MIHEYQSRDDHQSTSPHFSADSALQLPLIPICPTDNNSRGSPSAHSPPLVKSGGDEESLAEIQVVGSRGQRYAPNSSSSMARAAQSATTGASRAQASLKLHFVVEKVAKPKLRFLGIDPRLPDAA